MQYGLKRSKETAQTIFNGNHTKEINKVLHLKVEDTIGADYLGMETHM